MRTLAETDGILVIQGYTWLGFALIGVALLVAVTVLALRNRVPRVARLGAYLSSILLIYAGWQLIVPNTTLEPRGYYVESIYGEEERMGWLQVRGVTPPGGGHPDHLVLQLRTSGEASLDLSGLSPEERARVLKFVRARVGN